MNALLTEPIPNTVSSAFAVPFASSARPNAARQSRPPPSITRVPLNPASAHRPNALVNSASQPAAASRSGSSSMVQAADSSAAATMTEMRFMRRTVRAAL